MSIEIKGNSTQENFITQLETRGLTFVVDEPVDKGGQNTAATPMELIGGALSSCTIITLQMYFNHKQWKYSKIEVDVDFDDQSFPITFNRVIKINGEFDEKQIERIHRIANACPVHKLLEVGHQIETTIEII